MENVVFTQLSIPEVRAIFRQELKSYFESKPAADPQKESDVILTIQQAADLLNLSVPTIYGLVSKSVIPVSKRGKRLYFSKQDLTRWIKEGRKKTTAEIQAEANTYLQTKSKRG